MAKKTKKKEIKPGTSLQEIDVASPGGNLESYINSIHSIGILSSEEEKKLFMTRNVQIMPVRNVQQRTLVLFILHL